ncbi:MAG: hypothetical protein PVI49_01350 [Desulfobacterales bacterium]
MSNHNSIASHLGENDILQAVIDDTDLSQGVKQHLNECAHCRLQKERFEQELERLGQLAKRYAPEPRRRVTVDTARVRRPFLNWKFAFGAAAVAVTIIIVWATVLIQTQQPGSVGNLAQNMVEAERLMTEIDVLVENALPPVYLEIVGETDLNPDEEFLEFLIPDTEDSPRISALTMKGPARC